MQNEKSPGETKRLLRLAVPVILNQVGNMMMGLVDTMVVGQYSSLALAGVAAGNSIFYTVAMLGVGYLGAMDPIVAGARGAREPRRALQCLATALQQVFVFSLIATPLMFLFASHLDWTGATADVANAATPFLKVMALGLLPMLMIQALQKYWQGFEVVLPFTVVMVLGNIVNYVLAIILVPGRWGIPPMGAVGAAWGSLAVRLLSLTCVILYTLWRRIDMVTLRQMLRSWQQDMHRYLWKLGLPAGAQVGFEVCAFSLTTLLVARLGAQTLATHQIVLNIASFSFMFPLGLSAATATRVGYHMGRKDRPLALHTGWLAIGMGILMMVVAAVILFTFPETLLRLFTQESAVVAMGVTVIVLCSLFQIFDGIQVVSSGVLRGLGDTKTALYTNMVSHWCIGLPTGIALCFWLNKGLWGLWVGLALGLFFTAVLNTYAILRKRLT